MSITLKPGARLFGATSTTEAIVVKAPAHAVDIRIGGHAVVLSAAERSADGSVLAGHDTPVLMGKRYVDASGTLELLCTKAGAGAFAIGDDLCEVKDAKPLPASD
jgi:hypothetical protein